MSELPLKLTIKRGKRLINIWDEIAKKKGCKVGHLYSRDYPQVKKQ